MTDRENYVAQGHCDARFDNVKSALADAIASGEEVGAAIAIDVDGENVVDIWGGHTDSAKTTEWTQDTIINVWSSTKTVTSLAAPMLVDRGLVELSAPVAKYWPEFAANGKQDIEVRHILSTLRMYRVGNRHFAPRTSTTGENPPAYVTDEKICFWGGWAGSMVLIDPTRRTTMAYVMTRMGPGLHGSERTAKYATLIYEALGSVR